tara:strand:+ start:5563 stop:6264 length:702 start_codon:yes stop_codon:yes gene_type:complete
MKHLLYTLTLLVSVGFLSSCNTNQKQMENTPIDWDSEFTTQGLHKIDTDSTKIIVELRYATTDNFMGKNVYGNLRTGYLQPEALSKLLNAQHMLNEEAPELRLLIYDVARPRRIQQVLWDSSDLPLEERSQYIANPVSGSIHNYGCAVDLTIAKADGTPLDMGTGYDDFSTLAHTDNEEELVAQGLLTSQQRENRLLLRSVMTKAGFLTLDSEWWHFDAFSRSETKTRFSIVE